MVERIDADICVIGAGSGGLTLAAGASQMGAATVLIERARMGGDCLNTGCVPSKSLLAAARVAHTLSRGAPFGVTAPHVAADFAQARAPRTDGDYRDRARRFGGPIHRTRGPRHRGPRAFCRTARGGGGRCRNQRPPLRAGYRLGAPGAGHRRARRPGLSDQRDGVRQPHAARAPDRHRRRPGGRRARAGPPPPRRAGEHRGDGAPLGRRRSRARRGRRRGFAARRHRGVRRRQGHRAPPRRWRGGEGGNRGERRSARDYRLAPFDRRRAQGQRR